MENPSLMACYAELLQLEFGEVRSQLKLRYLPRVPAPHGQVQGAPAGTAPFGGN